jgi:hypothetical protein
MRHPLDGAVAQLGERVVRNDEVRSSILLSSTSGIIDFPLLLRRQDASSVPCLAMRRLGADTPKKGHGPFHAVSKARRLSIGLMAMAAAGSALFFLQAAPLDWRFQISFFCVL